MLNGAALGKAIKDAIKLKGVSKADVGRHFGIRPPSVHGWIKTGRVDKRHLSELFRYFSDVVGPEHWGLETLDPAPPDGTWSPERIPRWECREKDRSLSELYERASPATQAAVTLLLQPPAQRKALCEGHPHLITGINLLEGGSESAMLLAKSA